MSTHRVHRTGSKWFAISTNSIFKSSMHCLHSLTSDNCVIYALDRFFPLSPFTRLICVFFFAIKDRFHFSDWYCFLSLSVTLLRCPDIWPLSRASLSGSALRVVFGRGQRILLPDALFVDFTRFPGNATLRQAAEKVSIWEMKPILNGKEEHKSTS